MPASSSTTPSLLTAFDGWLATQQAQQRLRRPSSVLVYRAMWHALAAWCLAERPVVPLRALDAATLARYIASRQGMAGPDEPLTPRYQWRLLSLVQRVQLDHALRQALPPQLAAQELARRHPALRRAHLDTTDEEPARLPDDEAERLAAHLGAAPAPLQATAAQPLRWQTLRDHAAAGLQLGAGLGPGELRALRLADVDQLASRSPALPWQLRVPASGSAPAHTVPVSGWPARLLGRWLERRGHERLGGDWLFPSTRSGKPWGKVAQFESVRRLFVEVGIADSAGGSFKLRHTFALQQLRAGCPADTLARRLGVFDPGVMQRYQRLLAAEAAQAASRGATPAPGAADEATPGAAAAAMPGADPLAALGSPPAPRQCDG